jgi:hypothetical protein
MEMCHFISSQVTVSPGPLLHRTRGFALYVCFFSCNVKELDQNLPEILSNCNILNSNTLFFIFSLTSLTHPPLPHMTAYTSQVTSPHWTMSIQVEKTLTLNHRCFSTVESDTVIFNYFPAHFTIPLTCLCQSHKHSSKKKKEKQLTSLFKHEASSIGIPTPFAHLALT